MLGATSKANFNTYFHTFQNTMRSFDELTDPEKLNREPERIRIRSVQQTGTLSNALSAYQMPQKRLEELAVLNGMQLNDRVQQGMLIKTVERSGPISVKR